MLRSAFNDILKECYSAGEISVLWHRTLCAVCRVEMSKTYILTDVDISETEANEILTVADRLAAGEPLEYILGFAEFCSMNFKVNRSTLIPRLETQELVQFIKETYPSDSPLRILDIGTGSGCIAIALALLFPKAMVTALDISPEALDVARENAITLGAGNIEFTECDILSEEGRLEGEEYDLIVSNPPYVRPSEKSTMPVRVLKFEPKTALFVPEKDPLIFYRRIAEVASGRLARDGMVMVEINQWLSDETAEVFENCGFTTTAMKDGYSNYRFLTARR